MIHEGDLQRISDIYMEHISALENMQVSELTADSVITDYKRFKEYTQDKFVMDSIIIPLIDIINGRTGKKTDINEKLVGVAIGHAVYDVLGNREKYQYSRKYKISFRGSATALSGKNETDEIKSFYNLEDAIRYATERIDINHKNTCNTEYSGFERKDIPKNCLFSYVIRKAYGNEIHEFTYTIIRK